MAFNPYDARWQARLLKERSERSMSPKRGVASVREGAVTKAAAGRQEDVKHLFRSAALRKKALDYSAAHSGRMMGLTESYLSSQEKAFPFITGAGFLQSGLAWWEGRKRASQMAEDRRRQQYMINRINQRTEAAESGIPFRYLYGPGGK